jgi:CheY-like chemotaxis protein
MNDKNLVLIAEDDDVSCQFLKTVFAKIGVQTLIATNGIEAIELVKSNPDLNLILMDIKMPELDGLIATKEIKAIRPDIKIIAQTAYALNSEKAKFLKEGCDDYISKPIEIDLLMKLIKKYIFI